MKTQKTVLVGLSGGVDSAVSAYLLKKKGYRVIGLFMQTFREDSRHKNPCKKGSKFTDEKMAEAVAKILKIKFISRNCKKEYYDEVIMPMVKDYARGLTPNPDIVCNKLIKFPRLIKEAERLGADYIATGHYAKIKKTKKGFSLLQAKDKTKDQSYFLCELNQESLAKTIFPVGSLTKEEVRKIAKKNGLPNWDKPGTTGICFLGKTPNIKSFLEQKIKQKKGKITSPEGKLLGYHPGIAYFTIGQKVQEHLGMKINKPKEHAQDRYYIAEKRKGNILVAVPENHPVLKKKQAAIHNFHQINPDNPIPTNGLTARIRHLGQFHGGKLKKTGKSFRFTFKKPVEALAEGQSIVIYKKSELIGAGEIRF